MKLLKASKILHIVVLLCCFLPAIFSGCEESPSKRELEQRYKDQQDSLAKIAVADTLKDNGFDSSLLENKRDTTIIDTTTMVNAADTITTETTVIESKADTRAVKNSDEEDSIFQKALNRLVFPDRENFSLIGFTFFAFIACGSVIFLFMLIWSMLLRFTNNNHKLMFIQTLIGQIALTIFITENFKDLMWGFWVVYAVSLFNAILNWRIYFEAKRNKLNNVWGDL